MREDGGADGPVRSIEHSAEGTGEAVDDAESGVGEGEAERRAWATVNKDDGGGKKGGSGRGRDTGHPAAHRGGALGGDASANRPADERSASARKGARTRKAGTNHHTHH